MTKEELIALSDLNREDNIKYISSEAQGIAIALDSDRYAPTLCKLERAYICGRRKSEKRIAELETDFLKACKVREQVCAEANQACERKDEKITELKTQIEKMKCCGNCKKLAQKFDSNTHVHILYCTKEETKGFEVGFQMNCCNWEMK